MLICVQLDTCTLHTVESRANVNIYVILQAPFYLIVIQRFESRVLFFLFAPYQNFNYLLFSHSRYILKLNYRNTRT